MAKDTKKVDETIEEPAVSSKAMKQASKVLSEKQKAGEINSDDTIKSIQIENNQAIVHTQSASFSFDIQEL